MKGYKAFEKGLICRNYKFKENEVFKEEKAVVCESGFHFCANPLDTLDYYPLIDSNGNLTEFAEVEALEKPVTDDNKKYCTKKIKIGAKLSLNGFIEAGFNFIKESCTATADTTAGEKIVRKKDEAVIAASGNDSKLAASGNDSQLAASGNYSKLAASGNDSQLAASGSYSQLAASGNDSQLAASGNDSKLAASGSYSKLAASGNDSKIELNGNNCVGANIGIGGIIKGKKGNWITLAEYDIWGKPICVKSAQIDGEKIKEDVFYKLKNGEFVEVE